MLLFNPALALAPLGTYFPVSSCFGFGRLLIFDGASFSNTTVWYFVTNLRASLSGSQAKSQLADLDQDGI
jgi:hypothetical protein